MRALATWVIVLSMTACQPPDRAENELSMCPDLSRYVPERASAEAAAAQRRGERYLLGVYGFTTEVPGQIDRSVPVRMIEGTSDSGCETLNNRAREYAKRFNETMQERPVEQ